MTLDDVTPPGARDAPNDGLLRPPRATELDAHAVTQAFDPGRLTLARERNGLTKTELATRLKLSPAAITQFERRQSRPSAQTLALAARELGVPLDYFAAGRPQLVPQPDAAHFRSLRATRQYERLQALALLAHAAEIVRVIEQLVRLPEPALVQLGPSNPVAAAQQLRLAWRIPDGPVPHLVRLLESKGVVVVIAPFGAEERIDAFSCWSEQLARPFVCLSRDRRNVLRRRFNAAHELGHLVMHRGARGGPIDREREAHTFAAEFLVPSEEIGPLLPHRVDLAALVELQREWGVSVQALLHRSKELGTLTDSASRQAWILLTKLGWRRDEPAEDLPGEWPSLLDQALDLAMPLGLTPDVLAAGLKLPMSEIVEVLGRRVDARPQLRLVLPPNAPPLMAQR